MEIFLCFLGRKNFFFSWTTLCPLSIILNTEIKIFLYPGTYRVFFNIKGSMRPLTSLAKASTSPVPRTFVLPPSGLVTVVSFSLRLLNQFLFPTMWPVLPESTIKSCSVASLEVLSYFELEAKFLGLVPGAFFMQACTRWPFCLQKVHSPFSLL